MKDAAGPHGGRYKGAVEGPAPDCSTGPSEPPFVFPLPRSLQLLAKNSCISATTLSIARLSIQ